jgi:hypothetical protein
VTTEILINVAPRENRAALIENGVLTELFVERQSRRGIVSNLYKGRVQRVLPGMQAAFIDVGLERTAFLHAADIAAPSPENTLIGNGSKELGQVEDIRRLVNEGDDILVQVVKDPMGTKGARLTTFVALPSRLMVYMPRGDGIGVSARIEDEAERARLKQLVGEAMPQNTHRRLHRAHRGAGRERRGDPRRHPVPRPPVAIRQGEGPALPRRASWSTRTCRCRRASCATSWHAASTGCWSTTPRRTNACSNSRRVSCRAAPRASSCTRARARSSTCTAWRRRSARRSSAACRSSPAGTWSSTRPSR